MNHKVLFFLSIAVIVVGISGIFIQKNSPGVETSISENTAALPEAIPEREIMVAEALRDLSPFDILTSDDYRLISLKTSSNLKDHLDISLLPHGGIKGALIKSNVSKGTYIIPADLVSAKDPLFISASLREGESPFSIPVLPADDYFLSAVHAGDKVSVYIRLNEVDRAKNVNVGLVPEGSTSASKNTPNYVMTRLLQDIIVLGSQRYATNKEEAKGNTYTRNNKKDEPIGNITLKLNQQQMIELFAVQKVGELFILPEGEAAEKVSMNEILPQFRSVKELRGRK